MILRMILTIILMMLVMIFIALMMFEDSDNDFSNYFEDKEGVMTIIQDLDEDDYDNDY